MPDETEADDGVIHALGEMPDDEAEQLAPLRGEPDPGAGGAAEEP